MRRNVIFPKLNGLMHGGDYNPDQWLDYPEILEKDIELMKKAGINEASLGIFSWSMYEPFEGQFDFSWLRKIMDNLYANGIYTILATPSGARPAWLDEKYPEAMRVDAYGVRNRHGLRHNHCMSSPKYREKVAIINRKLAEEFSDHPGLVMWHISNEYGGECYCDHCVARFRNYLAEKFDHDIEKLNKAWWTNFWSHRYTSFEQIDPPYSNGENSVMGLNLEWKRFTTWSMTDFMKFEIETLKKVNPDIPATTNFMTLYEGLDYHEMCKAVDVISWDSYPIFHNDYEGIQDTFLKNAFNHALMRCMKPGQPFMLMESAPGQVNWQPVNKLRRPGNHKLACFQAIASGSDSVQYFQWRKSRGSAEQFHGAVVDHIGTDDTRIFKEVAEVGALLKKAADVAGSVVESKVALLFDWDNRWAIDDMQGMAQATKNYDNVCMGMWSELMKLGVEADIISQEHDWSKYKVIFAPMMYLLHDGVGEKIKAYVENGGTVFTTYLAGYVDKNTLCHLGGFPGQGLSEVFGVISEELDTFYPSDRNGLIWKNGERIRTEVYDYAELLRVKDAEILATYESDFYAGSAAVTRKQYGKGVAYYFGCRVASSDMQQFFANILNEAGVATRELYGVEYHLRVAEDKTYEFFLNYTSCEQVLEGVSGTELLTGTSVEGTLTMATGDVAIVVH